MIGSITERSIRVGSQMLHFLTVVVGIAAAYFLTLQSLRIDLEAKAESAAVEALDKKLAGFEVLLKEGVVSKEQFFEFAKNTEARLARIEFYLKENSRGTIDKP